jgi:hypothetical protein
LGPVAGATICTAAMKGYFTSPALKFPLVPPGAPTPTTKRKVKLWARMIL